MTLPLAAGAHSKHVLAYHLVWCVKYRHTVLTRAIGDRCKEIIAEIAEEIDAQIVEIETDTDHVHVIEGGSARRLFQEFPSLRRRLWGGHLWSPSKYAATVGGAPLETLKKYVQEQRQQMID